MYSLAFVNNPTAVIVVLIIVLLLFGGSKIPEMMKGLGAGMREFKKAKQELMETLDPALHLNEPTRPMYAAGSPLAAVLKTAFLASAGIRERPP